MVLRGRGVGRAGGFRVRVHREPLRRRRSGTRAAVTTGTQREKKRSMGAVCGGRVAKPRKKCDQNCASSSLAPSPHLPKQRKKKSGGGGGKGGGRRKMLRNERFISHFCCHRSLVTGGSGWSLCTTHLTPWVARGSLLDLLLLWAPFAQGVVGGRDRMGNWWGWLSRQAELLLCVCVCVK